MYLLAFSILLLCSALNLKAQGEQAEQLQMAAQNAASQQTLHLNRVLPDGGGNQVERAEADEVKYRPLLSDEESRFFEAASRALATIECSVMAKVNLEDVLSASRLSRDQQGRFEKTRRKLEGKHVDFVVCWGGALNVLVAARLDPAPGIRPLQRLMRRRVDELLEAAGIPVVIFPPADRYDEAEILSALTPHLV